MKNNIQAIAIDQLANVTGGDGGPVCTPDNPQAQFRPTEEARSLPRDADTRSLNDRVIDYMDNHVNQGWKIFNGLFGGAAATAPRPQGPSPQLPQIR